MSKLPLFVANWKMYKKGDEVDHFFQEFSPFTPSLPLHQIMIAVPAIWIERSCRLASQAVSIGAQNCAPYDEGAYTGEISAKMIASTEARFCLVGHSERRTIFKETNQEVNEKVKLLLSYDIRPVLCVGESKEEKESGLEKKVIEQQILEALQDVSSDELKKIIIAYEPVWSIGTGLVPQPSLISDIHRFCKEVLFQNLGDEASTVPVLYGGSVKEDNVEELLREKDIDGVLVGGASLSAQQFIDIIRKGMQIL